MLPEKTKTVLRKKTFQQNFDIVGIGRYYKIYTNPE